MQIALRAAVSPSAAALPGRRRAAVAAALLSLAVAWVHFAYMASHFRQWWGYGAFFLAAGAGQALFAPLILRRPRPWLLAVGIAGNVAIVAMYVVTRTAGPPLGPHAHVPEPAGAVDLATTAAEVVLVGVLLTMAGAATRRWVTNLVLGIGVLLWVMRLTGRLP
jgi:hypothetical protein